MQSSGQPIPHEEQRSEQSTSQENSEWNITEQPGFFSISNPSSDETIISLTIEKKEIEKIDLCNIKINFNLQTNLASPFFSIFIRSFLDKINEADRHTNIHLNRELNTFSISNKKVQVAKALLEVIDEHNLFPTKSIKEKAFNTIDAIRLTNFQVLLFTLPNTPPNSPPNTSPNTSTQSRDDSSIEEKRDTSPTQRR